MQLTSGSEGGSILSWNSAGVAIPPIRDLRKIFAMLFQPTGQGELSSLKRLINNRLASSIWLSPMQDC